MNRQGQYDAFNLGLGQDQPHADTWQNRERMIGFFGSDYCGVYARQVHGKGVGSLRQGEHWDSSRASGSMRLEGDALVTDQRSAALVIQVADCQPIILVDPVQGVVANIHSGWRGSIQNVIGETVSRMASDFSCRPENLICGIGPSLGPCCAEFIHYNEEIPASLWGYRHKGTLFDFWQMSKDQLVGAGVKEDNITLAEICTRCNPHLFFSYRGEKCAGRFAAVVGIRPKKEC